MRKYGFTYAKDGIIPADQKEKIVNCAASIQKIYKRYGKGRFEDVLYVIRNAWNGADKSTSSSILNGINTFMEHYEFELDRLIDAIENYSPAKILAFAQVRANGKATRSDGSCFPVAQTIRDLYEEYTFQNKKKYKSR